MAEGRKADAEEVLQQAKRDLPHNPDSFLALSNFYFTTGDLDKAVAEYHALYQERPKDLQVKEEIYSTSHSGQAIRRGAQPRR